MTKYHVCLSVRGVLRCSDAELRNDYMKWVLEDDGKPFLTPAALREAMMDELVQGHEKLPLSLDCDNFDYKKGCLGHPSSTTARVVKGGA